MMTKALSTICVHMLKCLKCMFGQKACLWYSSISNQSFLTAVISIVKLDFIDYSFSSLLMSSMLMSLLLMSFYCYLLFRLIKQRLVEGPSWMCQDMKTKSSLVFWFTLRTPSKDQVITELHEPQLQIGFTIILSYTRLRQCFGPHCTRLYFDRLNFTPLH